MQAVFKNDCLLDSTRILLLGISGGPDSMCLLDLLYQAGYQLVVAHLDHGLRPESAQDAQFVQDLSDRMKIPCLIHREDVLSYANSNSISIEEAARLLRYRFLFEEACRWNAQAVVVGHTADDQVETILMHWLRGAGLDGLRGMPYIQLPNPWSDSIPIVRPLLGCRRTEITAYLQGRGLQPLMDASNQDKTYFRNRLRHELIPYLETYNPNAVDHILNMANIIQEDSTVLEQCTDSAWQACVRDQGTRYVGFDRARFLSQPLGLQRRLLRKAIALQRPGLLDITFQVIENAINFIQVPPATMQVDLAAGLYLLMEGDWVWFSSWASALPMRGWPQIQEAGLSFFGPGKMYLDDGWQLIFDEIPDTAWAYQQAQNNQDPYQAWLDGENMRLPLQVRPRLPGDRIQPLGMDQGTIKVSDFMVNTKLPRRARLKWPLVCSGDRIIWLPGFTICHLDRLKPETRKVYHLSLQRSDPGG